LVSLLSQVRTYFKNKVIAPPPRAEVPLCEAQSFCWSRSAGKCWHTTQSFKNIVVCRNTNADSVLQKSKSLENSFRKIESGISNTHFLDRLSLRNFPD